MNVYSDSRGVSPIAAVILYTAIVVLVSGLLIVGVAGALLSTSLSETALHILAAIGVLGIVRSILNGVKYAREGVPTENDESALTDEECQLLADAEPGDEVVLVADSHSGVYRLASEKDADVGPAFELEQLHTETEHSPLTHILFEENRSTAKVVLADPVEEESASVDVRSLARR